MHPARQESIYERILREARERRASLSDRLREQLLRIQAKRAAHGE
jgi:hypothetical protein